MSDSIKGSVAKKRTRSSEINIAPDINNNLRFIDLFRSMII